MGMKDMRNEINMANKILGGAEINEISGIN